MLQTQKRKQAKYFGPFDLRRLVVKLKNSFDSRKFIDFSNMFKTKIYNLKFYLGKFFQFSVDFSESSKSRNVILNFSKYEQNKTDYIA